MSNLNAP